MSIPLSQNNAVSLKAFIHRLTTAHPLDIIPILTLFILLFHGYSIWYVKFFTMVLAIAALLYRELLRSPVYWFIFSCIIGFSIFSHWHPIDNHKFLLLYVTITLFCAYLASSGSQLKIIAGNARLFIIVLMGMSVFWKLYSSDPYLDGTFFEYIYLSDQRFMVFLSSFGIDMQQLGNNQQALFDIQQAYLGKDVIATQVYSPPLLKIIAWLTGWWVVIIEVAIAVLFMFRTALMDKYGHWALLLFIATTYIPAPVYGFGWTLSVLGYAVSQTHWATYGRWYLGCILLLMIYQLPWRLFLPG